MELFPKRCSIEGTVGRVEKKETANDIWRERRGRCHDLELNERRLLPKDADDAEPAARRPHLGAAGTVAGVERVQAPAPRPVPTGGRLGARRHRRGVGRRFGRRGRLPDAARPPGRPTGGFGHSGRPAADSGAPPAAAAADAAAGAHRPAAGGARLLKRRSSPVPAPPVPVPESANAVQRRHCAPVCFFVVVSVSLSFSLSLSFTLSPPYRPPSVLHSRFQPSGGSSLRQPKST